MTAEEARDILIQHNKWRRDNHVPNKYEMVDPTRLGVAIEIAIDALTTIDVLTKNINKSLALDNDYQLSLPF